MKFVILEKGITPRTLPHLVEVAENLGLEVVVVDVRNCSNQKIEFIQNLKEPYLMYAIIDTEEHFGIEAEFFTKNATTFYAKPETIFTCRNKAFQAICFKRNGIQSPTTFLSYDEDNLKEVVDGLGGFPLVIKTNYGEKGVGVIKIDSYEGLSSTLGLLKKEKINCLIQEYIEADYYLRTVIVGKEVLGTIRYDIPKDDFRLTMAYKEKPVKALLSEEMKRQCLKSMQVLGVEFAGIDLLVRGDDLYILEVNFPCIYLNMQSVMEKNISQKIITYLMEKQKRSL